MSYGCYTQSWCIEPHRSYRNRWHNTFLQLAKQSSRKIVVAPFLKTQQHRIATWEQTREIFPPQGRCSVMLFVVVVVVVAAAAAVVVVV